MVVFAPISTSSPDGDAAHLGTFTHVPHPARTEAVAPTTAPE